MPQREIYGVAYSETKSKILNEATKLFAFKGYGAVSMRDLGDKVGIKMATIYYYYEGKEALFADIMHHFEIGYKHYFEWLQGENKKANTLDELMDNMFNKEVFGMTDLNNRLGMSLALKEQHSNEFAKRCVLEVLHGYSIKCIKEDFDSLIEKGIIPPTDTKVIAEFFMNNILIINDMHIHEYNGENLPFSCFERYSNLKKHISYSLMQYNN